MVETLDYITAKEYIDEKLYVENRRLLQQYLVVKDNYKECVKQVNEILFSNQLNKIIKILSFTDESNPNF